jgi:hypothetical protein
MKDWSIDLPFTGGNIGIGGRFPVGIVNSNKYDNVGTPPDIDTPLTQYTSPNIPQATPPVTPSAGDYRFYQDPGVQPGDDYRFYNDPGVQPNSNLTAGDSNQNMIPGFNNAGAYGQVLPTLVGAAQLLDKPGEVRYDVPDHKARSFKPIQSAIKNQAAEAMAKAQYNMKQSGVTDPNKIGKLASIMGDSTGQSLAMARGQFDAQEAQRLDQYNRMKAAYDRAGVDATAADLATWQSNIYDTSAETADRLAGISTDKNKYELDKYVLEQRLKNQRDYLDYIRNKG